MTKTNGNEPVALIIDDEQSIVDTLADVLSDEGWRPYTASSGLKGLELYKKTSPDLVLLDVWMEGIDGIETLQRMKDLRKDIPIVIMSGHGTIDTAVRATKLGAYDFLEKPLSLEKILDIMEAVRKLKVEKIEHTEVKMNPNEIIGESAPILSIKRQIETIAPRNSWVLITGENGSGKEVVARNIHFKSKRADKPFIALNCAAIPEELIESELFGHSKGAFTNAIADKKGRFELANQGTLFLDEIGDMSLKTQAKILRLLQEQSFERIGDERTILVDVRVIAATNKNLHEEIKMGNFREDLFYRLNVIPIEMPPLRNRKADIPVLTDYFLNKMSKELEEPKRKLDQDVMSVLMEYNWPGNVRELCNVIERICIMSVKEQITLQDLPEGALALNSKQLQSDAFIDKYNFESGVSLKEARLEFERMFILERLEENDWNVTKTAELIGIERSNLHRKLRAYKIDPKRLKG